MGDSQSQIFYSAIARIATAQICQSIGFTGSQNKALDALANILTRYLQTLARSAAANANTSRRTHCNAFDLIHAIEQTNSNQGFEGSSNPNQPLSKSGIVRELIRFVRSIDETPFAQPLPRRVHPKRSDLWRRKGQPRSARDGKRCPPHVPPWLPEQPDPSAYREVGETRLWRRELRGFGDGGEKDRSSELRDAETRETRIDEVRSVKSMIKFLPIERERVRFKMGDGVKELGAKRGLKLSR